MARAERARRGDAPDGLHRRDGRRRWALRATLGRELSGTTRTVACARACGALGARAPFVATGVRHGARHVARAAPARASTRPTRVPILGLVQRRRRSGARRRSRRGSRRRLSARSRSRSASMSSDDARTREARSSASSPVAPRCASTRTRATTGSRGGDVRRARSIRKASSSSSSRARRATGTRIARRWRGGVAGPSDDAGRVDLRHRRHRARGGAEARVRVHQAQADEDRQPRCAGRGDRAHPRARHAAGARQRRCLRYRVLDGGVRRAHADRQCRRDERLPEARHACCSPSRCAFDAAARSSCSSRAMRRARRGRARVVHAATARFH